MKELNEIIAWTGLMVIAFYAGVFLVIWLTGAA